MILAIRTLVLLISVPFLQSWANAVDTLDSLPPECRDSHTGNWTSSLDIFHLMVVKRRDCHTFDAGCDVLHHVWET
jgi:hypothetical protein